ncbi:MAG: peptide chain release factor N(5)-glutamine methyltransferase [Gemmatimonadetes bacterium]|nr:peptide chain release factor N(5)-glutamine methyltransferase [Gemmatimonadota bacterium]
MTRELELAGLASPDVEARRLVAAALEIEPAELGASRKIGVDPAFAARVAKAVSRRLEGEPLQHVEGTADFRSLRLISDGRALIPRPETEQLVDLVARWVEARGAPADRALDIGTGSGAVALSLLDEGLAKRVIALDVAPAARALATENARRVEARGLELRACPSEIWPAVAEEPPFDLIVSNPPYVTSAEWVALDPVVRDHEPRVALDGGEDGLDVIRTIVHGAVGALGSDGALFLEIGASQGPEVLALLRSTRGLADARIERDLNGRERFATARRPA